MNKINSDNIDEKTKKYRELYDQIIVQVKNTPLEKQEELFRGWSEKNHIILEDIERLKKDNNDRYKIFAFLLETQFIEFTLIDLLQELEAVFNTDPDVIKFSGKKETKELYKFPLGSLYKKLCQYESNFLKKLKPLIYELNEKRIRFTHYLFTSIKEINEIIVEAKDGLILNEKAFNELQSVFEYIKQKTWYGQMYERKRIS